MRRRDGTTLLASVRAQMVRNAEGQAEIQGLFQDQTQARRAEQALRESERRLRHAEAVAHLGTWEFDVPSNRILISPRLAEMLDVPPGTHFTLETALALVPADQRLAVEAEYKRCVAEHREYAQEHGLALPSGKVLQVLHRARMDYDAEGRPMKGFGVMLDVTEGKRLQQALNASEEANRRLIEESPLAIVRTSPDGRFLSANPAALRLYGMRDLESLQKVNARQFFVDPDEREARLAQVNGAGSLNQETFRMRRLDGSEFVVRVHANAVRDAKGVVQSYEGIIEDITQQKAAEAARAELERKDAEVRRLNELNRMRMDFLNTAAHDLKTPLTPLKLAMATLRLRKVDPSQEESLGLMERNISRFNALVEDMLDAARLQAGKLRLKRAPTLLGPLVQDAVASFQESMRLGGLTVKVGAVPEARVDVDPLKAMQVLMNLVSNAVKYTPRGGHVLVEATMANDGTAVVSVRDSGLGMTQEQIGRLFQPFVRLHEDVPGTAKGTGLGLYISKGIVEQHGGRIWAESEGPGKGSAFFLAFPLAKTSGPLAAAAAERR